MPIAKIPKISFAEQSHASLVVFIQLVCNEKHCMASVHDGSFAEFKLLVQKSSYFLSFLNHRFDTFVDFCALFIAEA